VSAPCSSLLIDLNFLCGRDDMGLGTVDFHAKMSTLTEYDRQNCPNDSDDGDESSRP
jgi:hypothetical protein